ncbi:BBM_1a_G0028620.mRNA.1.CDS.1 [Saccharomyces cerevisiae]|nr:CPI_1c_G0028410.mRNA.1.CDS.1 [Saccharomyces cerevisiae]CAI4549296.1 BBM_1a_G0028620.mRNA.1.CDS.1 [Saccharomyces cerevisiae]CAI7169773.1 BBM_1a_G0028620.mRNA.1.CDS.1 [Saccharomyces cerevisiae]CAI7350887.1 CPI_1c_G0028410.mRNA.1.CDS.1 [Saccharomyces cerevisiae]
MSSLSDQLAQVASNNATVALDRKRRQKLHSASLIYNSKTAATQDYDFIFENASKALEELSQIEPKFAIFSRTLFSESSISLDRNVQTKEEIKDLDNAINAYLLLASSKWYLAPTLHATEWLVRRFQIHVKNTEMLLLSTLNYYQTPVFKRILSIIKLPPLFNCLSNFVRSEKPPTALTMIKLFNDMDFLKLYTSYLDQCIKHNATYTNQLLFTTCCFINVVAFNSNNDEKLNQLVPILLEISAKLLASKSKDCQIAAHTILVVFATALPLKKTIILAAMETILSNLDAKEAKHSALLTICKLFQTLKGQGNVDQLPSKIFKLFDSKFDTVSILTFLDKEDKPVCDKFITSYTRSIARYDRSKLNIILSLLKKIRLERYEVRLIITDLIYLSEILEDKSQLVELFEYFISINEDLVLKCLKSLGLTGELFEIRLTTSLFTNADVNTDIVKQLSDPVETTKKDTASFQTFLDKHSELINTTNVSMLTETGERYKKVLSLFTEAIGKGYKASSFLTSFFTTLESRITFLLRVTISPAAPTALKLISLNNIAKYINSIEKEANIFTLVPCLICALRDASIKVRTGVKKILSLIAKRPSTKHYFLSDKLYGENVAIPMLNPKDSEAWLSGFLNEYVTENYDISRILTPKRNEKVFLMFWANQALLIPSPYAKTVLLDNLNKSPTYAPSYSSLFEEFISHYLENRSSWEKSCIANKTNFEHFERSLVNLVSPKEKQSFMIDFVLSALNSDYEQLANIAAERLISIFASLNNAQKLKIVQNIVDSSSNVESSYDTVGVLQSLPLDSDIFVSILNQNSISNEMDQTDFSKRRRRRSSTSKNAFLKEEVSQLAELHLRKLTIILEALDKVRNVGSEKLLSTLLSLLSDLETLDQDGGLPVLYAQETLISCTLNTITYLKEHGCTELTNVRADILVSAIRNSASPQVQNKLLLVIGSLATLSSEVILHSVMPIFTFMGAHSIRQDDEFTTKVVERTILTVVPALIKNSKGNEKEEMEFLLLSFTTALQHVPRHRRVKLFSTLIKTLDPVKALGSFLFLIAQQYSSALVNFKIGEARILIEFIKALLVDLHVNEELSGLNDLLDIIKLLTSSKSSSEKKKPLESRVLFSNGVLNFSESEFLTFMNNTFEFINKITEETDQDYHDVRRNLRLKVYSVLLDETSDKKLIRNIREEFGTLLEGVLFFINSVELTFSCITSQENEEASDSETSLSDHTTEIKGILFKVLGNVLQILPVDEFVNAVLPLLSTSTNEDIRYHLTLVIGSKFELEGSEAIPIVNNVMKVLLDRMPLESKSVVISQVILNTMTALVSKYGKKLEGSILTQALTLATENVSSDMTEVKISSLALITNCVQVLGVKSIAFYPKIVPPSIELFDASLADSSNPLKEQLQVAILLLFAGLIKRIPSFLMSNILDVLHVIYFSREVDSSIRLSVISLIIENIDLKEVLKVLFRIWSTEIATSNDTVAVSLFLSTLESTVENIDKKSATSQSPIFFKLLLSLFEFRSISSFDNNTISRIEASVHEISNSYVLKMNDKVFRPLFVILVRWAFDGEGVTNAGITETERLLAFFKFFNKLQENLRGIITSYFTYLLEPVDMLLKRFISKDIENVNLRRLVINSLTSSLKFDRDEYWKSTSRFELISVSLVNQLSNIENSIGKYLVKAIGALASNNSGVDEHNQILNKLIVEHMKASCSSNEKLWAIRAMKLIYSKIGESWLVLLPQLVPVIAELLEDDDEEIEREVRTGLVKVVENVLGEPFDRYLD